MPENDERLGPAKMTRPARLWRATKTIASSPLSLFPKEEIRRGADLIGELIDDMKRRPPGGGSLRLHQDRSFDVPASADQYGLSCAQLENALSRWRRGAAIFAYIAFGLGWVFFAGWIYRLATIPWTGGFVITAVEFLPFVLVFFLQAFKSALQNFQIRTRRLATPGEYLRTRDDFWPS
ncbi:hypothetical protein SAMN05444581_1225 [Methylocapsa palsarum]|uniref:Uncharacterized protein n=1 Tax=Methylocapsa palsarum TaxID=1612308 RepID=A0A1I4CIA4_9HYPH|nr:hypothetical protein SAMN05444581_1225 [Methylocapsa palsarum]